MARNMGSVPILDDSFYYVPGFLYLERPGAAVYADGFAGHVARSIGGEEDGRPGDFFGVAPARNRHVGKAFPGRFGRDAHLLLNGLGDYHAGGYAVHPDIVLRELDRQRLGEIDDRGFGRNDVPGHGSCKTAERSDYLRR